MQKYLRRVHRDGRKGEEDSECPLQRVRSGLEVKEKVAREVLTAALMKDKVACIREILLFDRYEDFKAIIGQFMSEEQLKTHQLLSHILQQSAIDEKSQEGESGKEASGRSDSHRNRAVKIATVIAGLALFILGYNKRAWIRQMIARVLKK